MIIRILFIIALGAAFGALLGSTRTCADGGCPLTANWKRGMLWGAALGLAFALTLSPNTGCKEQTAPTEVAGGDSPIILLSSTGDFQSQVLEHKGKAVVYFMSDWCGACKTYAPIFDKVARRFSESIPFIKIDAQKTEELSRKYNIEYLPTTIIFENGQEAKRMVGVTQEDELAAHL